MSLSSLNHTIAPDVFTASKEYDKRFSGSIGDYFLAVQREIVFSHLKRIATGTASILEVGGGHLQLTKDLLALGHSVTVHGSSEEALDKLYSSDLSSKVEKLVCPIDQLNKAAKRSDIIIALRLIPHVVDQNELLAQLVRLAKQGIIFDFATTRGLNSLSKLAYKFKKKIEKNTRPYFNHSPAEIKYTLQSLHCTDISFRGQFVFPMGLHRAIDNVSVSKLIENATKPVHDLWGNPIICGAKVSG